MASTLSGIVGQPVDLTLWASDDAVVDPLRKPSDSPVTIKWTKHRGPGEVTFSDAEPKVEKGDGRATATATFSVPGDYILRAQANDVSGEGGGGFQCCWTNAHVKVTVTGSSVR
jgi:hypothetical protein